MESTSEQQKKNYTQNTFDGLWNTQHSSSKWIGKYAPRFTTVSRCSRSIDVFNNVRIKFWNFLSGYSWNCNTNSLGHCVCMCERGFASAHFVLNHWEVGTEYCTRLIFMVEPHWKLVYFTRIPWCSSVLAGIWAGDFQLVLLRKEIYLIEGP